jgi:hypothetical protein
VVKKDLTPFEAAEAELRALVELKRKQVSFGILFSIHFIGNLRQFDFHCDDCLRNCDFEKLALL